MRMRLAPIYNVSLQVTYGAFNACNTATLQRSIATSPLWVLCIHSPWGELSPGAPKVAQVGIYGADPPAFCTDHCGSQYTVTVSSDEVARCELDEKGQAFDCQAPCAQYLCMVSAASSLAVSRSSRVSEAEDHDRQSQASGDVKMIQHAPFPAKAPSSQRNTFNDASLPEVPRRSAEVRAPHLALPTTS